LECGWSECVNELWRLMKTASFTLEFTLRLIAKV